MTVFFYGELRFRKAMCSSPVWAAGFSFTLTNGGRMKRVNLPFLFFLVFYQTGDGRLSRFCPDKITV